MEKRYDLLVELYNEEGELVRDYFDYCYDDIEQAFLGYLYQLDLVVYNLSNTARYVKSITLKENDKIVRQHVFEKEEFYKLHQD